ncbi:transcriptional regulator [Streptomyces sp. NPDC127112]|uniref:transcriptional regulator n=1 Tax=Streptomyces sp. NPDC127112 TaxID=3345364 RepID=UPI003643B1C0
MSTASSSSDPQALVVEPSAQRLTSTAGRIANGAYSWMQAVHWVHRFARYTSSRAHGPGRLNDTTLRLAQELSRLTPCRPGVAYLVRRLRVSVRTVKYHLGLLRESGLLTYVVIGTRLPGGLNRASEFALTIPAAFDRALGIRTRASDTYIRAITGVSEHGRPVLAFLGRAARRSTRRPGSHATTRRTATPRCTPIPGRSSRSSPPGTTSLPPEAKPDSGYDARVRPERRTVVSPMNAVGRRHQLARELIQQVRWLARAHTPRIAWVVRHVADAGWTAEEVIAVLAQREPARTVHRPSGFLADRLRGAHELYGTAARRQAVVAWWRDSHRAHQMRHTEWDTSWNAPLSASVTHAVETAFDRLCLPPHGSGADGTAAGSPSSEAQAGHAGRDTLTATQVKDLRAAAVYDPSLITTAIEFCGEAHALRLYGTELVVRTRRMTSAGRLVLGRWRAS